jgi:myo-inositol 2-dehydrogenase / D-chiro-inositol 1-dehydrogenase
MKSQTSASSSLTTRRDFLRTSSTAVAGAALVGAVATPGYAAEDNTLKVALIGCGGRGTGAAAQALSTKGPTRLVAMADFFEHRIQASHQNLATRFAGQMEVPRERQFVGMDGYKKAIDVVGKGGVVLLATPPAFRPLHLEYAVEKGCHVFMEKSFAVDAPGIRRVLRAGETAAGKNLKIASGLMSRHYQPLEEAVEQIHEGEIGEVITAWAYRMHGPVGLTPRKPGMSELAFQVANYSNFTWLNGSFIVDWLIHNIDVCCWVKDAWPVSVQGMGGRQVRMEPDQLFDHYAAEYHFPDGTRMHVQGRHMNRCWGFFGCIIHGATGSAVLGEGITQPRLFKGHHQVPEQMTWRYRGPERDQYQVEQDRLFDAIRSDRPYNEVERSAKSCLTAIMGRMACESGEMISWEAAMNSELVLAPGLDEMTMDSQPPVVANAEGQYPVAMPGQTQVL